MPSSVPAEMPPVDPEAPNDTDTSTPVGSGPRYHVGIAPTFHDAKTKLDGGEEKADYPEGGTRAWLVVLGAWCAMAPAMGFLNTLAILQAWISEHELPEYSDSKLGWIFSCYSFFLYFCGAQIGPIFDAHDIRFLIIPGSIGLVASAMLVSISSEFWHFLLAFGVLGGMSASLLFNPAIAAIGHWFNKRRGLATGVACTSGGLGGVAFPLVILYMSPKQSFGWAMRTIGFISLALLFAACCLLRKRLPPNKKAGAAIDLKALGDVKYGVTTLATFLIEFAVFIPYTYITSYAVWAGMDTDSAYLLNVLLNVGAIPGRVLPGYIADRFGAFNVMCSTAAACTVFIFALWLTAGSNEAAITAFTVLYGFWSGAAISLTPVCIGVVSEVENYGKRTGTTFFIASFGTLVGIPIAGAILEKDDGDYRGLVIFAGAMYGAALCAFILARGFAGSWSPKAVV